MATVAKWTPEQLAGALVHVAHGHTRASGGHKWLSPEMIEMARRTVPASTFAPIRGSDCLIPGMIRDEVTGKCKFALGQQVGRDDTPVGEAVMGRYGAALVPGNHVINRAVCLKGMVVGDDGLCYNKGQITNKQREWPRGRRPLLTGGDMRAISIAARAAGRLQRNQKRLEKIGLLKKPSRPRPRLPAHTHQISSGN